MHAVTISPVEASVRLALALFLGTLVGFERQSRDHAAGMRTIAVVCLGSTLFMLVSAYGPAAILGTAHASFDPTRIAAQVVSGIGFLGAGAIFMQRKIVRGMTTAAGIWVVAGIGLAAGAGLYYIAMAGTALELVVLYALRFVEQRFFPLKQRIVIGLTLRNTELPSLHRVLSALGAQVLEVRVEVDDDGRHSCKLTCSAPLHLGVEHVVTALTALGDRVLVEAGALYDAETDDTTNRS
jgi:putative Mg2+ transporter-C (MgtC) family protein